MWPMLQRRSKSTIAYKTKKCYPNKQESHIFQSAIIPKVKAKPQLLSNIFLSAPLPELKIRNKQLNVFEKEDKIRKIVQRPYQPMQNGEDFPCKLTNKEFGFSLRRFQQNDSINQIITGQADLKEQPVHYPIQSLSHKDVFMPFDQDYGYSKHFNHATKNQLKPQNTFKTAESAEALEKEALFQKLLEDQQIV